METATENTTRPTNETAALTFRDRAIPMAKLNVPVIRLHERKKNPMDKEWQNLATTDSKRSQCNLEKIGFIFTFYRLIYVARLATFLRRN